MTNKPKKAWAHETSQGRYIVFVGWTRGRILQIYPFKKNDLVKIEVKF